MRNLFFTIIIFTVATFQVIEASSQQTFGRSIMGTSDGFAGGALWSSPGFNVVPLGSGGRAMNVLRPYANINYTITNVTDETDFVLYAVANLGNIAGQIDRNSEDFNELVEAEKDKLLSKVDGIYLGLSPTYMMSDFSEDSDNELKFSVDFPIGFKYYIQNVETGSNGGAISESIDLLSLNFGLGVYIKYNKLILYPSYMASSSLVPEDFERAFPATKKAIHGPGFDLLLPLGENFGSLISFNHIINSGNSFKIGLIFTK